MVDALTRPGGSVTGPGRIQGQYQRAIDSNFDLIEVELYQQAAGGGRGALVATAPTDSEGSYAFPSVTPGCYVVAFAAPPGDAFEIGGGSTLDVPACVQSGEVRVIDPELEDDLGAVAITGHVERDGEWVAGVAVDLYESNQQRQRLTFIEATSTNDNTSGVSFAFEVPTNLASCWILTFTAPNGSTFTDGGQYRNEHVCLIQGSPVGAEVVVSLAGSTDGVIGGRVTRAGSPESGVRSNLYRAAADGSRSVWLGSMSTGGDGTYSFAAGAGCYVVTLGPAPDGSTFSNGSSWQNLGACIAGGELSTDNDGQLTAGLTPISGSVTNSGQSVEGLRINLYSRAADGSRAGWLGSTSTDANGDYQHNVSAGCYVLTFGPAPDGQTFVNGSIWQNRSICVEDGTAATIDAVLLGGTSGSISGSVTQGSGGIAGVSVDLFEAADDGSRAGFLRSTDTSATGAYTLEAPAGCYVLTFGPAPDGEVFTNGSVWRNLPVCIGDDEDAVGHDAELRP